MGAFDPWFAKGIYDPIGLVKGWGADKAVKKLQEFGALSGQVNAAGDISVFGSYPNERGLKPWKIGIRSPWDPLKVVKVFEMNDGAIATSGTYEKGAHIINPRTGLPATGALSATVVGPNGAWAEALATALVVSGREGVNWFQMPELSEYGAWVIDRHSEIAWSVGRL